MNLNGKAAEMGESTMHRGNWQSSCFNKAREGYGPAQKAGVRERKLAKGFSLIELLIVVAIILIIASIAIPSLIEQKKLANETSAVNSLKVIRDAESHYSAAYPEVGFADSLLKLGPGGNSDSSHAGLIPGDLANGAKHGYRFSLTGASAGTPATVNSFVATAVPSSNMSGRRTFCVNESGVIRQQSGSGTCDPENSQPVQ